MTGFGFFELCAIFLLALVLFGPKELPKLARFVAKLIYEMKNIFQRLEKEWNLSEYQNTSSSIKKESQSVNTENELQSGQIKNSNTKQTEEKKS